MLPWTDGVIMTSTAMETVPVIDCDSHLIEPADLWTTRVSKRFVEDAPHLERVEDTGLMHWRVGRHLLHPVTTGAYAGWKDPFPALPATLEEADPACYDPVARIQRLDEYGVWQQLLFPNLVGFQIFAFADLEDADLRLECIRAYNDFQTDFASCAPDRLVPQMFLPIWDLDACLAEMKRCADLGHKAINFGIEMDRIGLPAFRSGHWDPLFAQAQDYGLPLVFHIGFSQLTAAETKNFEAVDATDITKNATLFMLGNASGIVEVIMSGVAHRFPRLNFVSIESGFGYIPYLLESLDWQFLNLGVPAQHPDWLLPSEYFRRQIYAAFWFESNLDLQIHLYPDNVMFSSDFPHPTSLSPGPGSIARTPRETIETNLARVPEDIRRKLVHDTASRVYGLG
jgi:predicted TIM-barrel fold metal-dependent hydrolase